MRVFKVERFVLDERGERVPLTDEHSHPVLVKRGPQEGEPAYKKRVYLDAQGQPRWRAVVYDPVERRTVARTFLTKKEADKWARSQEGRKERRESLTGDRRSVAEYLAWWLDMKATGAVKGKRGLQRTAPRSRTLHDYRKTAARWLDRPPTGMPALGRVRMDKVSHRDLDDFYAAMLSETTAGAVRRFHGLLAQAFEEAVRKGYLPYNPCDRASVPQTVPQVDGAEPDDDVEEDSEGASRSMTEEQAVRFLAVARELERDGPYAALWHLLTLAGLRPTEAFALAWEDLDLDAPRPTVRVRRNLAMNKRTPDQRERRAAAGWHFEPPKTKKGRREVPLPTLVAKELQVWRTQQKRQRLVAGDEWTERGLVFTTGKGTPLGSNNRAYRRSFARVMARANGEEGRDGEGRHEESGDEEGSRENGREEDSCEDRGEEGCG